MKYTYTRKDILLKIEELIKQSNYLSFSLINYANNIVNEDDLEKFLIIIYETVQNENKLNKDEKIIVNGILNNIYNNVTFVIRKYLVKFINKLENLNKN